jgi:hypothetical protein
MSQISSILYLRDGAIFFNNVTLNSMNSNEATKNSVISTIKEWAAPTLIGIVAMLVWRDITELRTDVKLLLYNQSANEVKIRTLEDNVKSLEGRLLVMTQASHSHPIQEKPSHSFKNIYAIKDDDYKVLFDDKKKK